MTGAARVEFGMYPFASVASAWTALWAAVHERVPWTPARLTSTDDVHAGWSDDACTVTQICGGPLMATHRHDWEVVGAFALDVEHASDTAHYRSVLFSPHARSIDELTTPTTRVIANSADSLSGWTSLLATTVGPGGAWPGPVTYVGSHLASLRGLADGRADLASIDSWSLAILGDERSELLDGLHPVGLGPVVPTPAVAARPSLGAQRLAELGDALDDAVGDPELGEALSALHIRGFARLTIDDYLPILRLQAAG